MPVSLVIDDTAFTQTAIAVLITVALALALQAKLLGAPATHPISSGARRTFVVFELYLTVTLAIVGLGLAYVLFGHLASDTRPLSQADRRLVGSLLLFLLTGVALIAMGNRIVAVAWKRPERDYLEPALDEDVLAGLSPAISVAAAAALPVVVDSDRLGIAWLVILLFGLVVIGAVAVSSTLGARAQRRGASRLEARLEGYRYTSSLVDVQLPDGADRLTVKVFEPPGESAARYVSTTDASRLVRHLNGAWEATRQRDPYDDEVPERLRLLLTRDLTFAVVAKSWPQVGARRSKWSGRCSPTGSPRGLVRWAAGAGVPPLPRARDPAAIRAGPSD